MIVKVDLVEAGDVIPIDGTLGVVTHTTRDGKGRFVIRTEVEARYYPNEEVRIIRKVGT